MHLFLLAGDGHVDALAADTLASRKSRVLCFRDGVDGEPFPLTLPEERTSIIDRLVTIVTEQPDLDLSLLGQAHNLHQARLNAIEPCKIRPLARTVDAIRRVAQPTLLQGKEPE